MKELWTPMGAVSVGVLTVLSSTIFIPKQDTQKEGDPEVKKDAKERVPWVLGCLE